MTKPTQNLMTHTIAFWHERTGQEFSQDDARQMVANVSGFFLVLAEWERRAAEEHQAQSDEGAPHA